MLENRALPMKATGVRKVTLEMRFDELGEYASEIWKVLVLLRDNRFELKKNAAELRAFGTVLWILLVASGIVGWRRIKRDSEEKKRIVRVPKSRWSRFKFLVSALANPQ